MAAAQCARLPFRKRAQTGPERPLVRAWRRTRVSVQGLSFGISAILSSCLIPGVLEGAEQLFLFLLIHHPGYYSYLPLEHTIGALERTRRAQHPFLNLRRQLSKLH